jgi:hypothetical protein
LCKPEKLPHAFTLRERHRGFSTNFSTFLLKTQRGNFLRSGLTGEAFVPESFPRGAIWGPL